MASRILWTLTGRIARRVYLGLVLSLVATSVTARIYTLVLTRRMEAVIAGLSKLQVDKSTEEDVRRTVPHLVRWQWGGQLKRSPRPATSISVLSKAIPSRFPTSSAG